QRRFHQRWRRRGAESLAIILNEHRRRPGHVRPRLARAADERVTIRDRRPHVVVVAELGSQRRNPRSRRDNVRFDAAVFTRSAAEATPRPYNAPLSSTSPTAALPAMIPATWVPWECSSLASVSEPYCMKASTRPARSGCIVAASPVSRPLSATATATPEPSKP